MFEMPIDISVGHGGNPLCEGVLEQWKNPHWGIKYVGADCLFHAHLEATRDGYTIGAIVHKLFDGCIIVALENPQKQFMTSWQCPFKGEITPAKIIEVMEACIEIFETEEIPEPEEDEEEEG